jgi:hypothetical protein
MILVALLGICGITVLSSAAGCAHREGKTVRYTEEQREGEVQEDAPGEMVVE